MITEKDVLLACCGTDESGKAKASIRIQTSKLDVNNNKEEIIDELTIIGPVANIFRSYRYTMVDLQFYSGTDYDFVQAVNILQRFCTPENSMDARDNIIPAIVLTLSPKEYELEYFCAGMHGTWCLMPSGVGKETDTIRFIFDNEMFHTYELNDKNLDTEQLQTAISDNL